MVENTDIRQRKACVPFFGTCASLNRAGKETMTRT